MTLTSRWVSQVTCASLLAAVSCPTWAGWIGDAWNGLADAGHDVVTLGEHGRQRDRERAEKDAQASAAAAAAAEAQRQLQITAITKDVVLLRDVTRSFESSATAVADITKLQDEVTKATQAEITKRQASMFLIEKVRDYFRSDNDDLMKVVRALDTDFARKTDMERSFGKAADVTTLNSVKAKQDESITTLKTKLDVLKTAHLTEDAYLEESIQKLNTSGLEQVLSYTQQSRTRLNSLALELEQSRKEYRGQLTTQLDSLAVIAKSDRAALATQYEGGLKPNAPSTPVAGGASSGSSASANFGPISASASFGAAAAVVPIATGAITQTPPKKVCLSFGGNCFMVRVP